MNAMPTLSVTQFATMNLLALMLFGCDTTEVIELGERAPQLTVSSFPDHATFWNVQIGLSKGILDDADYLGLPGASVVILENGNFLEKLTCVNPDDPGISFFQSASTGPKPGSTYTLQVNASGFPKGSGMYTQPLPVPVDSLVISLLETVTYSLETRIQVHLTDKAGDDYYALVFTGVDSTDTENRTWISYSQFVDPAFQQEQVFYYTYLAFSDAPFEGKKAIIDLHSFFRPSVFSFDKTPPPYVTVYLLHLSKEYFSFIQSIYFQGKTSFDPLAQPVQVKSNIQNGLGIFAGYTETRKTVAVTY